MNEDIAQQILREVFSALEAVETQSAGILQFLKDKGIAKEEELAPYLEQAGNTSSVRWLAARVRIEYLLSSAMKTEEEARKEPSKSAQNSEEPRNPDTEASRKKESDNDA